jgi:hypothetical protein
LRINRHATTELCPCALFGREQILADGFETAYHVLKAQYLMFCGERFAEAQSWQATEAVLLAIR